MKIIFNDTDNSSLDIIPADNSFRYREIMGDNKLTIYFSLPRFVEIPINATCVFQGETYTLLRSEDFKKKGTRNYEYTLVMHSDIEKFKRYKLRNTIDGRIKFSYIATPREFIQLVVDNLNIRESGWSVGECIEATEQSISFSHNNCAEVLRSIADTFDTEFEIAGKVISLHKVEYNKENPLPLSYGKGNGFKPGSGRTNYDDSFPVEILFVEGGERNIDASAYGSSALLLPKGQSYEYNGRTYVTDEQGMFIRRVDKDIVYNNEDSLDCTHIYPSRTGEVTSVVTVNEDEHWYNIVDNTIPDALDYSEHIIVGETPTMIFQTGMLATREFSIETDSDGNLTGYDHGAKEFQLVPTEYSGIPMPNETYKPAAGDTYAVFGISLPDAYICDNETQSGASWNMFKEACKYMYEHEEPCFTFSGELDGIYAKKNWLAIGGKIILGGYVSFSDVQFDGANVRIMNIKDYINNPYSPVIDLSNSTVGNMVDTELKKIETNEVVADDNYKSSIRYAKRGFREMRETSEMLMDSLLNYSGEISPIVVRTMQLMVGDVSLQFQFVDDKTTPTAIPHTIAFNTTTKKLESAAGIIKHGTLGIDSLSPVHSADEYKYWNVAAYTSPVLADPAKKYYLYIKASKTAETAVMLLSETAIALEGVSGYYHFLTGMLNTEFDGDRSFVPMYGITEVLPGQMILELLRSAGGQSYWDMLNNAFKLGDKLNFNISGDGKLRLKGPLVQSESGDESPVGVFRGVYNATSPYYKGDEVTYTSNSATSTYRYIYATASSGKVPTNTTYWQIVASAGSNGVDGQDGADGQNGTDGDFYEYRYAVNGSTSTPPSISAASAEPSGWSTTIPSVGVLQYLWFTVAKKTASGSLLSNWSTPQRHTPVDGQDGEDGQDGADGAIGPAPTYRGEYSSTKTYYGTTNRVDIVKYGSIYYVARTDAGEFVGVLPTNSSKWNTFGGQFESIATGLLLAEKAVVENLIVKELITSAENPVVNITNDEQRFGPLSFLNGSLVTTNGNNKLELTANQVEFDFENNSESGTLAGVSCTNQAYSDKDSLVESTVSTNYFQVPSGNYDGTIGFKVGGTFNIPSTIPIDDRSILINSIKVKLMKANTSDPVETYMLVENVNVTALSYTIEDVIVLDDTLSLSEGSYTLKLELAYTPSFAVSYNNQIIEIELKDITFSYTNQMPFRTVKISPFGCGYGVNDNQFWTLTENDYGELEFRYKGGWGAPPVLACGSVVKDGGGCKMANLWKSLNVTGSMYAGKTGNYMRVRHYLGNTNYTVQVTPMYLDDTSKGIDFRILKSVDYFDVYFNDGGSYPFDFTMYLSPTVPSTTSSDILADEPLTNLI